MYAVKNKVQLIGNLGQDPEIRQVGETKKVANFSVATSETYRNATGEKVKETQWHKVTAWDKLAEVAEKFMLKGTEVVVEGKLVHHEYTDKQGVKRYVTEVLATELLVLSKKS